MKTHRILNWLRPALTLVVLQGAIFGYGQLALAGTPSKIVVRFDRMASAQPTTGMVCLAPTVSTAITSVTVTFPAGFVVSTTTANWTVNTTNTAWPSGASALSNVGTANSAAGQVVSFPVSPSFTPTVGSLYCFNWINSAALTQPTTAVLIPNEDGTVATNADSGGFGTATMGGATGDQVSVSAAVPQYFSFSLDNNTDPLGTLNKASVNSSPTPRNATVSTNAKNGWIAWVKDLNTGLTSATASRTIASTTPGVNSTLSAGVEGYNLGATTNVVAPSIANGSCTTMSSSTSAVDPAFRGAVSGKGGGVDTSLRTLASCDGTSTSAVITLTNNVTISGSTPSAPDYSDTEFYIAAGNF